MDVVKDIQIIPIFWAAVALGCVLLLRRVYSHGMRPNDLPRGPPTLPLIGNLHIMPTKNFHLEFQKLAQQYGPIVPLKLGLRDMFLVNDPTVVRDLLEKRSSIYSCRPDLYTRYFGDNLNILLRDNDDIWRRQRKVFHVPLKLQASNTYLPYQNFESLQLLNDLLLCQRDWVEHVFRFTGSIASSMICGWRTPKTGAGYTKDLIEYVRLFSDSANFQLVDFYPFLRPLYHALPFWILPSKRRLYKIKQLGDKVFSDMFNRAKEQLANGKGYPSIIREMILDESDDRLDDRQIAHNAGSGFAGILDTSANTILGFIKAMVLFPDVQAQAQQELDSIVGCSRLPVWEDRPNLPYIRGVVEETLRWAPTVLSAGIPHSTKQDDIYRGMKIPKGSMVMMNVWTLNNQRYENPRDFDPMRHSAQSTLLESNVINPDSRLRLHFTFGAGRRVCPGYHLAERILFVAISRMLWAFNMQRARDSHGNFTPINRDAVSPGLIVRPEDFECNIKLRDPARGALIQNLWQEAEKGLDSEGNYQEEAIWKSFAEG